MFSSKSFIVSGLAFRSLIHFEFIFVYGVRKYSNFVLLHVAEAQAAATGALSAAERSYPTSEVRGRSQEDPMLQEWWPRGVSPPLRSGAVAESARLQWRRNSREELPQSKVRGGGWEELPCI